MSLLILTFHGLGPPPREPQPGEADCWLEQEAFEEVLDLVVGQPHVRLTFDDGNASDAETALPLLTQRSLTATFFVCSNLVDQPTYLSRNQLRELRQTGMRIGSHGADHVSWRNLSPERFRQEVVESRRALEQMCGVPITDASCPFGEYDSHVLSGLRQAGYKCVYTSDDGTCREGDWLKARTTVLRRSPLSSVQRLIARGPTRLDQLMVDLKKLYKRRRPFVFSS